MIKANAAAQSPPNTSTSYSSSPENSVKNDKKKKVPFFFHRIFSFNLFCFPMCKLLVFWRISCCSWLSVLSKNPFNFGEVYSSKDIRIKTKWEKLRWRIIQGRWWRISSFRFYIALWIFYHPCLDFRSGLSGCSLIFLCNCFH